MKRRRFLGLMSALCATAALPNPLMAAQVPLPKPETRLPRGMVTFTFDDGIASNYEYALPILRSRNQLATAGIVATRITSGNNDYMNVDQVRELEKAGWEIASHSLTHTRPIHIPKTYEQELITGWHEDEKTPGHYQAQYEYERIAGLYQDGKLLAEVESLANLEARKGVFWLDRAIAEIHVRPERAGAPDALAIRAGSYQRELEESKRILTGLGFNVDTYIAPHNYWTDDVEAMSRAYYARACTGRDSDNRPASFDPFAIKRFMVHTKDTPQSYARIIRDHCLEHGGWVVFCFHGTGASTGWEPYSSEGLDWLSAWIAQEKVPVVTVREGAAVMQELKKKLPGSNGKNIAKKGS